MKALLLICASLCLAFPLSSLRGQLLNGDFEFSFYGSGVPSEWKANAGDGNSNIQDTTHLSPFTNVYRAGRNSVRLADGTTDSIYPNLVQGYAPSTSDFVFSFDFNVDAVNDAPWRVTIGDGVTANLDFLLDAANSFQFVGGTSGTVMTLSPGVWYQLSATISDTTKTFSGSLTPFGSSPTFFSGLTYLNGPARTSAVEVRDFSSSQNSTLYLDNFSVQTVVVPEPSASGFLVCGLAALLGTRRLSSSMRRRQAGVN